MYLLYLFAWKVIGVLPEKKAYKLANLVSDRIFNKNGKGVKRLRSNYKRVASNISERELDELTKDGMRSYLRYWFDTFRLNKWSKSRIIETTFVVRENLLRDPIETKKGCIIALPHAGNWDHAAAYFCSTGIPITAVVERLKPEAIFKKFLAYRQSIGIEAISHREKTIPILIDRLNQGKLVALVADRDMSRYGIEVNFLGGVTKMPAGPAILAIKTGSPLVTAYIRYLDKGIEITFDETIQLPISGSEEEQVRIVTQSMADNFAKRIKDSLVDWHMLQRIWVDEEN
ncbi:MAG: phosphatidylinositol mannoside acyltransferase [Actinobacteria bacterium]|nr:phosphatidylinositol mannoside acyltransferase [Actinomycetota bacterium]